MNAVAGLPAATGQYRMWALVPLALAAAAKDDAPNSDASIVDVKAVTSYGASGIALALMGVSLMLFLAMSFLYMKRIVKEVAATTSFLDLADPETRIEFTIERGSGAAG
jgi:hypothetical protein